jgi:hypothetical protein
MVGRLFINGGKVFIHGVKIIVSGEKVVFMVTGGSIYFMKGIKKG